MDQNYEPTQPHPPTITPQHPLQSHTHFGQSQQHSLHNFTHRSQENSSQSIYSLLENEEKVIPGYNFQSLFRKKSHIRLARKKAKEDNSKKNPHLKHLPTEAEAKNIQKGHWTPQENKLYHWFLELHNRHFVLKYLRRTDKIFKTMANFITSRQAEQCRSHHQKMQKKYHTFYHILAKLRMDFYGSTTTDLLKVQLEEHGYKIKQNTLITQAEIKNGDLAVRDSMMQEMEDSLGGLEEQSRQEKPHSNMLAQNYESGLSFGNMHY